MKICQTSLSEIFGDFFLRCDVKNILMRQKYDLNSFAKMSEFITFIETGKPITREDYAKESNNIHLVVRNISDGEVIYDDPVCPSVRSIPATLKSCSSITLSLSIVAYSS